jgi:hypothetical protein
MLAKPRLNDLVVLEKHSEKDRMPPGSAIRFAPLGRLRFSRRQIVATIDASMSLSAAPAPLKPPNSAASARRPCARHADRWSGGPEGPSLKGSRSRAFGRMWRCRWSWRGFIRAGALQSRTDAAEQSSLLKRLAQVANNALT